MTTSTPGIASLRSYPLAAIPLDLASPRHATGSLRSVPRPDLSHNPDTCTACVTVSGDLIAFTERLMLKGWGR